MFCSRLCTNGNDRAIAGSSSGGVCAFTAAWERPEAFRRVFTSVGTYVGLRGGNEYPALIRKTEPKPIRVFLQDGSNDLNIYGGDWWMVNQEMERALVFSGYEVNHAWGDGGHNGKHATAIFPDALRWLWRDYPAPILANPERKSKQPLMDILIPGEEWQLVAEGYGLVQPSTANAQGDVFIESVRSNRIHKIALDGEVGLQICDQAGRVNGIVLNPQNKAALWNAVFGGRDLDTLFVSCGDKVYKRKTRTTGVLSFQAPILPAAPRL